ncbi:MAG: arsenate reductase [Kiritimatiellia bacterium]|jgi:arsenate reductase
MALKIYTYKNCDSCRKALKYLDARDIAYTNIPIREQPPSLAELKRMASYLDGQMPKLFNTSGGDYRSMNLKQTLPDLSMDEQLELLHAHGNLVKRPFLLTDHAGTVGFKEAVWDALLEK